MCKCVNATQILGVVILVHGMGEHSGRYDKNVLKVLLDEGLAVIAYDNIGHGKSGGKRGHCPNYNALMAILDEMVIQAKKRVKNRPILLYGHSMGGNLVLNYALRHNRALTGVIASSPYLRLAFKPPKWKMVLGKLIMRIWPALTMSSGLDPEGISRDPEAVEKYISDPLVHDRVSPMFTFPIMDTGAWAIKNAGQLKVNTLLLHGTGDLITDHKATEEFHKNSKVTTLKTFSGGYHELHHDLCNDEMLQTVRYWLRKQL